MFGTSFKLSDPSTKRCIIHLTVPIFVTDSTMNIHVYGFHVKKGPTFYIGPIISSALFAFSSHFENIVINENAIL